MLQKTDSATSISYTSSSDSMKPRQDGVTDRIRCATAIRLSDWSTPIAVMATWRRVANVAQIARQCTYGCAILSPQAMHCWDRALVRCCSRWPSCSRPARIRAIDLVPRIAVQVRESPMAIFRSELGNFLSCKSRVSHTIWTPTISGCSIEEPPPTWSLIFILPNDNEKKLTM